MANVTKNLLVKAASGNVGKQFVYRTEDGVTSIVSMPKVRKRQPTESEKKIRKNFSAASRYGRSATASPVIGAAYKKKGGGSGKKAFGIAFKDYLTPPEVNGINALRYNGLPGSVVVVDASDDFKVAEVRVSIHDAGNVLIEEGLAVQDSITNLWEYTASQTNDILADTLIKAVASDVPGNEASLEVRL